MDKFVDDDSDISWNEPSGSGDDSDDNPGPYEAMSAAGMIEPYHAMK